MWYSPSSGSVLLLQLMSHRLDPVVESSGCGPFDPVVDSSCCTPVDPVVSTRVFDPTRIFQWVFDPIHRVVGTTDHPWWWNPTRTRKSTRDSIHPDAELVDLCRSVAHPFPRMDIDYITCCFYHWMFLFVYSSYSNCTLHSFFSYTELSNTLDRSTNT